MTRTGNVTAKAARLVDEGRVVKVDNHIWRVESDHGTYLTVALPAGLPVTQGPYQSCTCPAEGVCSHIVAVRFAERLGRAHALLRPGSDEYRAATDLLGGPV